MFKKKLSKLFNLINCQIGKGFSCILNSTRRKVFINHIKNHLISFRAGLFFVILVVIALIIPKHTVRYAVFAGYNADKTIHPYVISYLKGLNEVTDGVVYIADSELLPEEEEKLKGLVIYTEHRNHGEYDWGSYKRGFNWLKEKGYLKRADEIIFANDSCYAPMTSFKPMFKEMAQRKELDFWGDSQNDWRTKHLQSYFFVFRKRIIKSGALNLFLNNVFHQSNYMLYIVTYEIKLTPFLENLGYTWDSYIPYERLTNFEYNDKNSYPLTLIRDYNNQLLKRSILTKKLVSFEDVNLLMDYIKMHFPKLYSDIVFDFPAFLDSDNMKD